MDLTDAIHTRRSVREFAAQAVEPAMIEKLIGAAIQAPSAGNQQPWCFCVVRNKAVLARISRESKARMLRTTAVGLVSHHLHEVVSDPDFDIFYGAPVLIVIAATETSPWSVENCALAAAFLMLAARDAGLGTCWIGFAQAWLATEEGKAALGLPATAQPVAPIIVGHPKVEPPPVRRKPAEIVWIDP